MIRFRTINGVMSAAAAAGLLAVGCGGDDGGGDKSYGEPLAASQSELKLAEESVTSLDDVKVLATSDAGNEQAIGALSSSYGRLQTLMGVKLREQASSASNSPGSQFGFLSTVQSALDAGCYTTDGSTTTYNNCVTGGFTIDGTIGFAGETLTLNLTLASTSGGVAGISALAFSQKGSLNFGADSIVGTLSYDTDVTIDGSTPGAATDGTISSKSKIDAIYNVTMTDGCPTGGTLEINQVTTVDVSGLGNIPGGAGAGSQSTWVKAEFGPNCGDVTLF